MRSFVLGEGIVKKEADLAAEVEQQTKEFEKKAAEKAAAAADAPAAEVAAEVADAAKPAVQVTLPDVGIVCRSRADYVAVLVLGSHSM